MKLLSIDASGKTAACSVTENGMLIAKRFCASGLTHSQTLLPMVCDMLSEAEIDIQNIDEFALTIGPGSFTGLRIGAATVMGLANGRKCRCVSTLTAIAYNFEKENAIVVPALDARRSQVYTAVFKCENGTVTRISDDTAQSVEKTAEVISEYAKERKVYIAGDGAYLFNDLLKTADNVIFAKEESLYPQGLSIAKAAEDAEAIEAKDIKLSYLRLSQAERELKEKQKND